MAVPIRRWSSAELLIVPLLVTALAAAAPATSSAQVIYTITDLGTLGGPTNEARGINSAGQVTGRSSVSGSSGNPGPLHAYRSAPIGQPLGLTDLGVFPGGSTSYGSGINASGQVTGVAGLAGDVATHAFRTTATGTVSDPGTDLGTFSGGTGSVGNGINASGQVTGYASGTVGTHAFRTTANGLISDPGTDLGAFPGGTQSFGQGINDAGQVVGYSEYAAPTPPNSTGPTRAFRTTATGRVSDAGADLGTLGGSQSRGNAINSSGQATGISDTSFSLQQHAFRSSANGLPITLTDLGTLGGLFSEGMSINSLGVVVGRSAYIPGQGGQTHAFVYDTQMRDLNLLIPPNSGWELGTATGINDAGQITGVGGFGGLGHAFLLTPVAVPEPGALILAGTTAAVWCLCRAARIRAWASSQSSRPTTARI